MSLDLTAYRSHPREVERVRRLFDLVPQQGRTALDIGARDGHLSLILADRFESVVALDLCRPAIDHPRVQCVQGDASALQFDDASFDTVICAEVLEHIPPPLLEKVGREICRVTRQSAIIGVPYKQDLRVGRTRCGACGNSNPPWGHVNSFDEELLVTLLAGLKASKVEFVGQTRSATNPISARLLDYAGHPFGTYDQDEACIHCGAALGKPRARTLPQKIATRAACWLDAAQQRITPARGNWIHMRFDKAQPGCT